LSQNTQDETKATSGKDAGKLQNNATKLQKYKSGQRVGKIPANYKEQIRAEKEKVPPSWGSSEFPSQ
jgi:hypothetical protein